MAYRWVGDPGDPFRRYLVDADGRSHPVAHVDCLMDGRWFVVAPDVDEPFHRTFESAARAVEDALGVEVERPHE